MRYPFYRIALSIVFLTVAVVIAGYDAFGPKLSVLLLMRKDFEKKLFPVAPPQPILAEEENEQQPEIWPKTLVLQVGPGDTLSSLLKKQGLSRNQIHSIIQPLKKVYRLQQLRSGHKITLLLGKPEERDSDRYKVISLCVRPEIEREFIVERKPDGTYTAKEHEIKLVRTLKWVEGEVYGSLSDDAIKRGVPIRALQEMTKIYSYDVDFQRDLQPGDRYGLLFAVYRDPQSKLERPGELIYASLTLSNKNFEIYRFQLDKNNSYEFFNGRGESVKKALLRTPVDGARLTSHFGKRRHPMSGYTKHHKGVDFGAPIGTPIMAAGDGIIEQIGRWGAYGNYIRIRHNRTYATAYAHLSRYAQGLRRGKRICQGQVIGYVGATGRSTGPHLHYEVLKNNLQINPLTLTFMPTGKLYGKYLDAFNRFKREVEGHRARLVTARADTQTTQPTTMIRKG